MGTHLREPPHLLTGQERTNLAMSKRTNACTAHNKAGKRCQAAVLPGSTFCFFHDPESADKCRQARSEGGRQGRARTLPTDTPDVPVQSCADVARLLSGTINEVRRGELDPRVANAVGYLANVLLKAVEQGEVERRLAELESAVKGERPALALAAEEE